MTTTFMILIDALRHDYINEIDAPFLTSLQKSGLHGRVEESFGFLSMPVFLSGLSPEDVGACMHFVYSPKTSPYQFLSAPIIRHFVRTSLSTQSLRSISNRLITRMIAFRDPSIGKAAYPHYIPFDFLGYFDTATRFSPASVAYSRHLNVRTIFDVLRQIGRSWLYLGEPDNLGTESIVSTYRKTMRRDIKFVFCHLAELDWVTHASGPEGIERHTCIRGIDEGIEQLFQHRAVQGEGINYFIFGDHGMVPVKGEIDVVGELRGLSARLHRDYIYFSDSTTVRFWFFDSASRYEVLDLLNGIPGGRVLTADDYSNFNIQFKDNRNWEAIYLAEPGNIIHPNFFQGTDEVLGMHGYRPDYIDNQGAFITSYSPMMDGSALTYALRMVDIFPTVLDIMEIECPRQIKGKSLFNRQN